MKTAPLRSLSLLLALAALAACNPTGGTPQLPTGVSTSPLASGTPAAAPSATPTATPSTAPSDAPSAGPSASAGPSLAPGVLFRDDFDGTELDPARWTAYEKSGIIRLKDGVLDISAGGQARDYPLILANGDILPAEGPFYFELRYTTKLPGRPPGFHLDYLPPTGPDGPGLTTPFMQGLIFQSELAFRFTGESSAPSLYQKGSLAIDVPHRLRVERDADDNWRGIFDNSEYVTLKSERQPRRFWIGEIANKPLGGTTSWARLAIDYVVVGVLAEPDPATPPPKAPTP